MLASPLPPPRLHRFLPSGFTLGAEAWLPVNENHAWLNVQAQEATQDSHLAVYRALAALRQEPPFRRGALSFPHTSDKVFTMHRSAKNSHNGAKYQHCFLAAARAASSKAHSRCYYYYAGERLIAFETITQLTNDIC